MDLYIYDYDAYTETIRFTSADYETECGVYVGAAWDEVIEDYDDEQVKIIVNGEISDRYPSAVIHWEPVPIEYDLKAIAEALGA